jgi:hypothetical protein
MIGTSKARRSHNVGALAASSLFALTVLLRAPSRAEDSLPPLRRVYVPADQVQALGERYPELQSLARDEFEDLARRAQLGGQPSLPQVESARYQAVLEGDRLSGTAELTIHGKRDGPSMLRWPASPWTISEARWPVGGASLGFARRGELGLLVPAGESHTLNFNWSIATRATEAGKRFEFRVPRSVWGELALDLPRGLTPVAPSAVVSGPTNAPRPELQRWLLRWTPADSVQCVLVLEGGSRPPSPLIVYGREMEIDVAEDGTELRARLDVFVAHQPIGQLAFECSPGLKLFGWSGVKVHDWQERGNHVFLDLAEPLVGSAQITVRALAPGPIDGQWSLPRLEIAQGQWTGGQTRVRSVAGLNLFDPHVSTGRVVSAYDLASARPELVVEHTAPDAGFTVRASAESPQVFARVHSSIELGPRLEATVAASWQVASGETTSLQLLVPPGWSLEDVDVQPDGLLARWSVDPDDSKLPIATLRFSRPLGAETSISATFRLRGVAMDATSSRGEFPIPRLRPLGVHSAEETLSIEMKPSWTAELIDAKNVSATTRPSALGPAVAGSPNVLSYRFDGSQASGKIVVSRRPPELMAKIEVNADVNEEQTRASYVLDLDIASGQPDWVDVSFQTETGDKLTWELPDGAHAERLDGDAWPALGSEFWRITLFRRDARRVRLNASWRSTTGSRAEIPLPTILQATPTTGQVAVTFPVELDLDAETTDLVASTAPAVGDSGQHLSRSLRRQAWRYGSGLPQLAIRVGPRPKLLTPEAWITHTGMRTTLDARGNAIHTVRYEIRSNPGTELILLPPSVASLQYIKSNGRPVAVEDSSRIQLTCPHGREVWLVEVQFVTAGAAVGHWAKLKFELPRISVPSARFSWEIDAPTGYQPLAWTRGLTATRPWAKKRWAERLLGPLARESDEQPFKFWEADAWRNWWQSQTHSASDPFADQLRQALASFDREVLPYDRTWARLIAHVDQFADHRLVLDMIGLRESGVDLDSRVGFKPNAAADGYFGLARTMELNLLRTKRGLLLTSREAAVELATPEDGTELRRLRSRRGLPEAIDEATLHGADSSGRFALASHAVRLDVSLDSEPRGDMAAVIDVPWRFDALADPSAVSITLVSNSLTAQATTSFVCVALLLVFVPKSRPSRRWLRGWSLLVAGAFVAALTVPDAMAAPAAVLAWSQVVALIVRTRRPTREADRKSPRDITAQLPSTITKAVTAGALLVLALAPWQTSTADVQDEQVPKYSLVFIPYDRAHPDKRHEAARVLVPREIHERLVRLAASSADNIEPVLIRSAAYSGRLAGDRLDLAIDFDIESVSSDAAVRASLPLSGVLIRSAELDGNPCLLESGPDGLTVEVLGRGIHKLHVETVLAVDAAAGEGFIALKIPPTPAARLNLELPPDITWDLEPASASIEWIKETQKQRLLAELGAVDRLIARWRRGPAMPAEFSVDIASLFTSKLGASRLEVRANVYVQSGSSRKLMIEMDPQLVLERVRAAGMTGYWLRPGDRPQVVLEFERPLEKQVVVGLEFLVPGAAGPLVHVPEIRIAGAKAGLRIVAAPAETGVTLEIAEPKEATLATAEDFQSVWGESLPRSPDSLIVQLPANSPALRIERKQSVDRPVFRAIVQIRATPTRNDLVTQLTCESSTARSFRHELALPVGLELSSVRASAGTQWRQVASDRLVWFGLSNDDSAPSIELQGWVPSDSNSGRLPVVRPLGDCQLIGDVTVWRSRDGRVVVHDEVGMRPTALTRDLRPPSPSLVAESQYEIFSPEFTAGVRVERLTPRISATVASRITIEDAGMEWISVLDYQATDGAISKLAFRVPDSIAPPLQIAGEGICHRDVRREGSEQVWTIQLDEPRWSSYRLVLRARIDARGESSVPVPFADPLQVADVRKYLLVLTATEEQFELLGAEKQVSIATDGFSKWFSEPVPKNALGSFELRDPSERIELRRTRPALPISPLTTLFEQHRAWLKTSRTIFAESTAVIRARADGNGYFALPESISVVDLHVDGQAVRPTRDANGQLGFHLAADDLPHEVKLWWTWESPASAVAGGNQRVVLPRLTNDDCPAAWTVYLPEQRKIESSSAPATCRSSLELAETRAIGNFLEQLIDLSGSLDPNERAAVSVAEQSFIGSAESVRRSLAAEAEVAPNSADLQSDHDRATQQLRRLLDENRELLNRAGLASLRARAEAQSARLGSLNGSGPSVFRNGTTANVAAERASARIRRPRQGSPAYFATESRNQSLSLEVSDGLQSNGVQRIPAALCGLAIWVACTWFTRTERRTLALAVGLAALGTLWCWKLRVEPLGPAMLLFAVIVALGGLIRERRRAARPGALGRLSA